MIDFAPETFTDSKTGLVHSGFKPWMKSYNLQVIETRNSEDPTNYHQYYIDYPQNVIKKEKKQKEA